LKRKCRLAGAWFALDEIQPVRIEPAAKHVIQAPNAGT
jgi:hypothetical protein